MDVERNERHRSALPNGKRRTTDRVLLIVCCVLHLALNIFNWLAGGKILSFWNFVCLLAVIADGALLYFDFSVKKGKLCTVTAGAFMALNSYLFFSGVIQLLGVLYYSRYLARGYIISGYSSAYAVASGICEMVPFILCVVYLLPFSECGSAVVRCPSCQLENPVKSRWCGRCGAKLPGNSGFEKVALGSGIALVAGGIVDMALSYFNSRRFNGSSFTIGDWLSVAGANINMWAPPLLYLLTLVGLIVAVRNYKSKWYIPVCFSGAFIVREAVTVLTSLF